MRTIEDLTDEEIAEVWDACFAGETRKQRIRRTMRAPQAKLDRENDKVACNARFRSKHDKASICEKESGHTGGHIGREDVAPETGTVTREMTIHSADLERLRRTGSGMFNLAAGDIPSSHSVRILITLPAEKCSPGRHVAGVCDDLCDVESGRVGKAGGVRDARSAGPLVGRGQPEPEACGEISRGQARSAPQDAGMPRRQPSEPPKVTPENCPCRNKPRYVAPCCGGGNGGREDCCVCHEPEVGKKACLKCGRQPETGKAQAPALDQLRFSDLHDVNARRCADAFKHDVDGWGLMQWACAAAGEMGETCNLVKKIERGDFALESVRVELGDELADVVIYLDLLAHRARIDLGAAVRRKFNSVSEKRGSKIVIDPPKPTLREAVRAFIEKAHVQIEEYDALVEAFEREEKA